jgi:hypothetical protein
VRDLQASLAEAVYNKGYLEMALCKKGLDIEQRDCVIRDLKKKLDANKSVSHRTEKKKIEHIVRNLEDCCQRLRCEAHS